MSPSVENGPVSLDAPSEGYGDWLAEKTEQDNPTIGLLPCKSKNKIVAEYALGDKAQPMSIAKYKLLESLPGELQTSLPSIEQIERELADDTSMEDDFQ